MNWEHEELKLTLKSVGFGDSYFPLRALSCLSELYILVLPGVLVFGFCF